MIPSLDLMLATIGRALEVAVLPRSTDASAREEAGLALLFARWMRDVFDDVATAERASARDCRAALGDVRALLEKDPAGAGALAEIGAAPALALDEASPQALVREETTRVKALLGKTLRRLRAEGAEALARTVRLRLYDLGVREIERERAFGRATQLDPDWQTLPTLAELLRGEARAGKEER